MNLVGFSDFLELCELSASCLNRQHKVLHPYLDQPIDSPPLIAYPNKSFPSVYMISLRWFSFKMEVLFILRGNCYTTAVLQKLMVKLFAENSHRIWGKQIVTNQKVSSLLVRCRSTRSCFIGYRERRVMQNESYHNDGHSKIYLWEQRWQKYCGDNKILFDWT